MKTPKPHRQINQKRIIIFFLGISTILVTFIIWYSRFNLGLIRYFDPDEMLYPNWTAHLLMGNLPYVDFMMIVTPLYLLFNIPFFLYWHGSDPLIISRIASFILTAALGISLSLLFYRVRKSWLALLVPLTISILPMPSDKFLEIRPDTLAVTFFIIGLIFQIDWMSYGKKRLFWSGIFYSLSLLTLQKYIPQITLCVLVVLFMSRKEIFKISFFRWPFINILFGLSIPLSVFLVWIYFFSGNPQLVIYSLTRLPFEAASMHKDKMYLFYYFLPNISYYGQWGYGMGIIINHALWIIGLSVALIRMVSIPFINDKLKVQEFLISALCILSVIFYLNSPLIFPQYLIPIAIFIAFYISDAINFLYKKLNKNLFSLFFFSTLYLAVLWTFYSAYNVTHQIKFGWSNQEVFGKMDQIFSTIPKNEYVLDMDGRTLYYKYPYYLCCLSFEIPNFMSYKLPSLKKALYKTKTKYIYQGTIERINFLLPEDREFVLENYTKSPDNQMFVAKNW